VNVTSAALVAHAGHWAGGVVASVVIVAVGVAVWLRERHADGDRNDAEVP
jgi:hypothetical protein